MITTGEEKAVESEQMLAKNLKSAVGAVKDMEQSYRSLALFFKNTDMDKLPNVSIMNADLEQVTDLDNDRFISAVSEEMQACFDRLDLRENYSILVLPGYLGSNKVLDKWSKIAHQNKVMLLSLIHI